MPTNPHAEAARAEVSGRLAAFKAARASIAADVRRARELGLAQAEIARLSGLTPHGVGKILARDPSEDPKRPA